MTRLVVVSGGETGIGRAVAHRLAGGGDQVVILGLRAELLEQAAEEINTALGTDRVRWHGADLTRPDEVLDAVAAINEVGDPVDVLVTNAGGRPHGDADAPVEEADSRRRRYDPNVLATVLLTRALLPYLRRPGGRVIATGSAAASRGTGSYDAAKDTLRAWAHGLVPTLAEDGITIDVVAPPLDPDVDPDPESAAFRRHAAALDGHLDRLLDLLNTPRQGSEHA
ncbi:SDR family NAD(P)-dependent oxidoreductase [Actinomadura sp. 9N215]|uniref:SDR family NAD(P)-dependent oxidoreductase n=1 Tax=Actinomadura sp. 9N215 TaxID=3375150 RepID=UPI00378F812A